MKVMFSKHEGRYLYTSMGWNPKILDFVIIFCTFEEVLNQKILQLHFFETQVFVGMWM
jgi:hypothetical protein